MEALSTRTLCVLMRTHVEALRQCFEDTSLVEDFHLDNLDDCIDQIEDSLSVREVNLCEM